MKEISIGYYPGCSGLGTSQEYDSSTRAICAALNVSLQDVPDWTCCGSTPAHTVDHVLAAALAARNFAQAEEVGIQELITPCPSCLKNLRNSLDGMEDPSFKQQVDELTQRPLKEKHSVKSVLQVLIEDVGLEQIKAQVKKPLTGLKVVPYYGCLMTRPAKSMRFDDPENPMSLDLILEALGAEVLPFPLKVECCGASFAIPKKEIVMQLSGKLLSLAADLGADMVVVACPLCQMNLDLRQGQINSANKTDISLPIPYFTQLMGYAFGLKSEDIGFKKLLVTIEGVLQKMEEKQAAVAIEEENKARLAAAKKSAESSANTSSEKGGAA